MRITDFRQTLGRTKRNLRRKRIQGAGHDFIGDVKKRLSHVEVQTIFDVGANIGLTAIEFSDEFPRANVYAFEPHPGNFARLKSNLSGKPKVQRFQLGLGAETGTLPFHFDPEHPTMSRIAAPGEAVTDRVAIDTIDHFCRQHDVDRIDLMKIDVEGHEIPVLKGAKGMLAEGRIHIVRIEAGLDPDVPYHTQLFELCEFLHPLGYRLFGFYDQNEFPPEPLNAKLRRFDVSFISRSAQQRPSPVEA